MRTRSPKLPRKARRAQAAARALLLAGVGACAPPPPPAPSAGLAEAQLEETLSGSVIEVQPLADPTVTLLLDRARRAREQGDLAAARRLLEEANALAPRDPAVWQAMAELSLAQRAWGEALGEARRSFELGPRVGRLCARNWLTMARAHAGLGDGDAARGAEAEARACARRAPERL